MSRLDGKVAMVTGAAQGIGAGIAKGLAAAGAPGVVADRNRADSVVTAIQDSGGRAIAVTGDVTKAADVARMFVETRAAYGAPDVLVNNAGVYKFDPIEAITEEEFHRHFNINVLGPLLMIREGVRAAGLVGDGGDYEKSWLAMTPLGRVGLPSDIAASAVFLASDDANWLT